MELLINLNMTMTMVDTCIGLAGPCISPAEFSRWLKRVDFYTVALDITDDDRKKGILLHLVGADVQDVYDTLPEPQVAATATEYGSAWRSSNSTCSPLVT